MNSGFNYHTKQCENCKAKINIFFTSKYQCMLPTGKVLCKRDKLCIECYPGKVTALLCKKGYLIEYVPINNVLI